MQDAGRVYKLNFVWNVQFLSEIVACQVALTLAHPDNNVTKSAKINYIMQCILIKRSDPTYWAYVFITFSKIKYVSESVFFVNDGSN